MLEDAIGAFCRQQSLSIDHVEVRSQGGDLIRRNVPVGELGLAEEEVLMVVDRGGGGEQRVAGDVAVQEEIEKEDEGVMMAKGEEEEFIQLKIRANDLKPAKYRMKEVSCFG